jgi:hypothetical protein
MLFEKGRRATIQQVVCRAVDSGYPLSHDLVEGSYVRAAPATEISGYDDDPTRSLSSRRGRRTVNVVPCASDDSTAMVPLCACTMRSAM